MRNRFQKANTVLKTKIEDTTNKLNNGIGWVLSSVLVPTHAVMDFVEKECESVMMKPSPGTTFLYNLARRNNNFGITFIWILYAKNVSR